MKIIDPSAEILNKPNGKNILKSIEIAGRVCYKSENQITINSSKKFVLSLIERGHEAVLEHEKVTMKIICDRGVSHELVRHRIASYCQESTRYCNYTKDKFNNELTFIKPSFWSNNSSQMDLWKQQMKSVEEAYFELINCGAKPQEARSVLPNSLKTEIVVTMNLREWRHFFKLRTAKVAHPDMRVIAIAALQQMKNLIPVVFDDIEVDK